MYGCLSERIEDGQCSLPIFLRVRQRTASLLCARLGHSANLKLSTSLLRQTVLGSVSLRKVPPRDQSVGGAL